jgi:hypothetical protein
VCRAPVEGRGTKGEVRMNDVESKTAAAAYEAVRAEAEALPADQVIARGVNLDDAVSRLLGVVAALGEDADLAARLAALPAAVFAPQHLERLPTLADALSYAHRRAKTEGATTSSAVVPFKTIEEATAARERMLSLSTYYLSSKQTVADELADIRSGKGHLDLAMDLDRLAALVQEHHGVLEKDPVHYRASDLVDGPKLAKEIRTAYYATTTNTWADNARRVFTLVDRSYGEVRAAAAFVFRHEPALADVFVALRPGGGRSRRPADTAPAAPADAGGGPQPG